MSAILKALERVQGERPAGEEGPEGMLPSATPTARGFSSQEPARSRPIWAGAALALVGVAIAAGVVIWDWDAGPGEAPATEFASVTPQPDHDRPPPGRAPLGSAGAPNEPGAPAAPAARRPLVPVPAETPLPPVDVAEVPHPSPDRRAPTARPLGRTTLASATPRPPQPAASDPGASRAALASPPERTGRANPPVLPSALGAAPPMPPRPPTRAPTRAPTRMPEPIVQASAPATTPPPEPAPPPQRAAEPVVARPEPVVEARAAVPVPAPAPVPKAAPEPAPVPEAAPKAKPVAEKPVRAVPAAMAEDASPFAVVEPIPELHIESTVWHPSPLRRAARVRVPGREEPLELHEGDAVGRLVVGEIQPSGVVFLQDGTEYRRAVGE